MRLWHKKQSGPIQVTGGKKGSKRHMLVDGGGVPLAMAITGANRHDVSQLETLLDRIIIERPDPFEHPQNLCLDKGYAGEPTLETVVLRGFIPDIKSLGQEKGSKEENPAYKARRWVVEVTRSWMNRFRKLLVRYEKLDKTYKGLLMLSCAFIALRKAKVT
jgi:transposase